MNTQISQAKLLLQRLQTGSGLRAQLARGALGGLVVSIAGIGVGFLAQVAIARTLGVAQFGVYAWALAAVNSLLLVCCSGLDGLMVRKLPSYLHDGQHGQARGLLLFSGYWIGGSALLAGLGLYVLALVLPTLMLPGSLNTLTVSILVLPLFALGSLRQAVLRALKRVARGQLLEAVVRPVFLVLFVGVLVYLLDDAATASTVMLAQLAASALVFAIGGFWMLKALPAQTKAAVPVWSGRSWLQESIPFLAISGASAVSRQVGMLALGAVGTASDTGIFAAMSRIADFSLMGSYAVSAIAAPLIVEVLKKNDKAGLAQVMKWGTRGSFAFAVAVVLGIGLFGEWILAAFGKGFAGGKEVLYLMLAGQLLWAFAGLSGFLLSMSGHAKVVAVIGWVSAVCNLFICVVFVPRFGAHAAASGYALTWALHGLAGLFYCWRYHKIWAGLR